MSHLPPAREPAEWGPGCTRGVRRALLKLPNAASTNCNDGAGGPADCHDNAFGFSGCWRLQTNGSKTIQTKIKLADLPGGDGNDAFYERAFITIDGQHDNIANRDRLREQIADSGRSRASFRNDVGHRFEMISASVPG
jgi:hypothetical protein